VPSPTALDAAGIFKTLHRHGVQSCETLETSCKPLHAEFTLLSRDECMWRVEHLELKPVAFDLQSSGQGIHRGHSLHADGTMVVNDLSLADLGSKPCQVIVCDACGTVGCNSGDWIVMRRFGPALAWIPDFERMRVPDFERARAAPPSYFKTRGAPLFGRPC
jgi:hypothetical protein